ncbi:MAG: efflux RND transporter periplasmic adaptor subunit [Acidobacteria bacterium]|nr:efflux RND transporter periplasmic adaptor subunit [Acidobacteriota bacterium]
MFRLGCCLAACLLFTACEKRSNQADGAPPSAEVIRDGNNGIVRVDKPELFPLVAADRIEAPNTLNVTGSVNPDISREVPVISLASGRVVDIRARLDDNVKKGDLLLRVQSPDITNAYDTYLKAANDERLANKAYIRAKDLYAHGAVAEAMLEQAEDTENDAKADLNAAEEQLNTLGVKKDHPSSIVNVFAPISGVIVAQNVTNASAAGVTFAGSSTVFTIADLSVVWIICDVYENDLPRIQLGQQAQIALNAYPDRTLMGRISDIGPVLDPSIRTAKVRIEVHNPGILRLGMFVTATLESKTKEVRAVVPATAILHLHDREWVFAPSGDKQFKRIEVTIGKTLSGNKQEIMSGITPGQQVVASALQMEATLEAQ